MEKILDNKVAIVTGAGSGIGRAIAELFADAGARVVVSDIDVKGGQDVVDGIVARGATASFVQADSSSPDQNAALVADAVERYGGLHVAVNNAGIGGPAAMAGEYPIDGWDKVIAINLSGVFYGMRHQIPAMLGSGGGSIVNIASILGQVGFRGSSAYVAAKHGVVGLTKNAAIEYAQQGVRVNAIGPGFIRTPLLDKNLTAEQLEGIAKLHPMGRLGESREVAELALFLASEKASFVTGSYYAADGGYLAQ